MIVIKTRQPDPELEQKIRMLLKREHIELRISSQFRFFQHIRHIRIAEDIQLTLHLQIAYRSATFLTSYDGSLSRVLSITC